MQAGRCPRDQPSGKGSHPGKKEVNGLHCRNEDEEHQSPRPAPNPALNRPENTGEGTNRPYGALAQPRNGLSTCSGILT